MAHRALISILILFLSMGMSRIVHSAYAAPEPSWFETWVGHYPEIQKQYALLSRSVRFKLESTQNTEFSLKETLNEKTQVKTRTLYFPQFPPDTFDLDQQYALSLRNIEFKLITDVTLGDYLRWTPPFNRILAEEPPAEDSQWVDLYRELILHPVEQKNAYGVIKSRTAEKLSALPKVKKKFLGISSDAEPTFEKLVLLLSSYHLRDEIEIPGAVKNLILQEQTRNNIADIQVYHSPLKSNLIQAFKPQSGNIFELPHVELGANEVVALGRSFPPQAFCENGKYAYYIHPQSLHFFQGLTATHTLIYDGMVATALASGRSLIAWNSNKPDETVFSLKTGLDASIGTVNRIIPGEEVLHATMISEGLAEIPSAYFERIGIKPFFEPSGLVPRDYEAGLLFKQLEGVVYKSEGSSFSQLDGYFPFFSLYTSEEEGGDALLIQLAKKSNMSPIAYGQEKILKPLVAGLIQLYVDYGFIPEPHSQNMLVHLRGGTIIGFGFRDLSGVAVDLELRKLRGLSNTFIDHGITQGGAFYRESYHVARGSTYLDKGLETHLMRGLVEGFDWIIPQSPKGTNASQILQEFLAKELRTAFADAIGVKEVDLRNGWAAGVRKAIEKTMRAKKPSLIQSALAVMENCSFWMKSVK